MDRPASKPLSQINAHAYNVTEGPADPFYEKQASEYLKGMHTSDIGDKTRISDNVSHHIEDMHGHDPEQVKLLDSIHTMRLKMFDHRTS